MALALAGTIMKHKKRTKILSLLVYSPLWHQLGTIPTWSDWLKRSEVPWYLLTYEQVRLVRFQKQIAILGRTYPVSAYLIKTLIPYIRYGRLMWMHNGGIAEFDKVKRKLQSCLSDDLFLFVQGNTDSEWAFALFLSFVRSIFQ